MKTRVARWLRTPTGNASRGQVLVWAAAMIPALLVIAALSLDTGRLWMARRALQNSVDAAALAGAWSLPDDIADARAVACDYGTVKNEVPEMRAVPDLPGYKCPGEEPKANVDIPEPHHRITVTSERVMKPTLGTIIAVFGQKPWPDITVRARATAAIGSIHTLCVFPLFQTQDLLEASGAWGTNADGFFVETNKPMIMKTNSGGATAGNFLYLQANGSSSKADIRGAIGSPEGCSGGEVTDSATTSTGNAVGPLDQGMEIRRGHYMNSASAGYCPGPDPWIPGPPTGPEGIALHPQLAGNPPVTPQNCYRVVQFPLLEGHSSTFNGTTTGKIRGFLTFYISNWCGQNSDPPKGSGSDAQHCAAPPGTGLPELEWGELWGYYLKYEAATEDEIQPYDGLGTKVVVLIE